MLIPVGCKIYLACGHTDMRRQIDGLVQIIEQNFKLDPYMNAVFLFCGRKSDRIKAILFDGDGFLLMYKRLEGKGRFRWPRNTQEVQELTEQQYRWLMEGLSIEQKYAIEKIGKRRSI